MNKELLLRFTDRFLDTTTDKDIAQAMLLKKRGLLMIVNVKHSGDVIEFYRWRLTAAGAEQRNKMIWERDVAAPLTDKQIKLLREFYDGKKSITLPTHPDDDERVKTMWGLKARHLVRVVHNIKEDRKPRNFKTVYAINRSGMDALALHEKETVAA